MKNLTNRILLAKPVLDDPNFTRTVIWLLEQGDQGTSGFVINRPISPKMGDIITDFPLPDFPVYLGGPVETNTLHFVHQYGAEAEGGLALSEDWKWGGSFETILELARQSRLREAEMRFFVGYSGWAPGQLEDEIQQDVWVEGPKFYPEILKMNPKSMWRLILRSMGGDYAIMANHPENPDLN
jgi:putative transcriptional regulator